MVVQIASARRAGEGEGPERLSGDGLGLAEADLTERVAEAMREVSRAYVAALVRGLGEEGFEGLTPATVSLLARLPREGTQTVDLARLTARSKQSAGKLVAELEAAGYAERVEDPHDKRGRLVRPTARGLAALAAGATVKEALGARAADALGAEALARLHADLDRLGRVLASDTRGDGGAPAPFAIEVAVDTARPPWQTGDTDGDRR